MRTSPFGIEKMIQDAQKEGKFDDLACKGQPLNVGFGDLASVASEVMRDNGIVPEWIELSRQIENLRARQAALIDALAERRASDRAELDQALEAWEPVRSAAGRPWHGVLRRWWLGDGRARLRAASQPPALVGRMESDRRRTLLQVAESVRTERKKVDRFNLVVPLAGRQMHRVRVAERLAEFQSRFPALSLVEESGAWHLREQVEPVDPSLVVSPDETDSARRQRSQEQATALQALRGGGRKPPPIG